LQVPQREGLGRDGKSRSAGGVVVGEIVKTEPVGIGSKLVTSKDYQKSII
jgi:hypothetical protein